MTTESALQRRNLPMRTVATAAAFSAAVSRPAIMRRWSRKGLQNTPPPPLPLISLPPDDEWEEFDMPTKTGFNYTLPHIDLPDEELQDHSASTCTSSISSSSSARHQRAAPPSLQLHHDRVGICRMLSEYMTQNELYQVRRHGFGVDRKLVYKRNKGAGGINTDATTTAPSSDDELAFNAFFESGNLDRAYRVLGRQYASTQELLSGGAGAGRSGSSPAENAQSSSGSSPFPFFIKADMEYDLHCDRDMSTHGHIQWYFFRVVVAAACWKRAAAAASSTPSSSSPSTLRVRFNIRNMLKKASLYNDGMLPAVYLDGPPGTSTRGWHHAGHNVCYFPNGDTYRNRKSGKMSNFYTLSFVYDFQMPPDLLATSSSPMRVYFAHSYPYTYTRLQKYLLALQKDPERNRVFRRRVLCKTIAGNICDVLTVTDFAQEDDSRSGIVLTARVHPGESNASFLMHGIIDFLTGPSLEARYLRHRFVFKIVPMLNPDGVLHGNYRCNIAGTDLNRRYVNPSSELHPTVYATKSMVLSMRKTRAISLYCDIHGHSRKKNMFLYGCVPYEEENSRTDAAKLRLFPHVLSKTCSSSSGGYYSFPDCTFSVSKSKKGTGRVVMWDEAHVLNSFTLEASFFGVGANRSGSSKRNTNTSTTTATVATAAAGTGAQAPSNQKSGGTTSISNNQAHKNSGESLGMTHFMPNDLRLAGAKFCGSLIPFAHLLDRDRPASPTSAASNAAIPFAATSSGGPSPLLRPYTAATGCVQVPNAGGTNGSPQSDQQQQLQPQWTADSKLRLAPLTCGAASSSAAPFPWTRARSSSHSSLSSPLSSHSSPPRGSISGVSSTGGSGGVCDATGYTTPASPRNLSFLAMDEMFASLACTDDLLKEIQDTLPENYAHCGGDSDDEGESAGSESDPSGDNMEDEELQRQDSWTKLVVDEPAAPPPEPKVPLLTKNRSQSLIKRFSESMLSLGSTIEQTSAMEINAVDLGLVQPAELAPLDSTPPAMTSSTDGKPVAATALAPLKATMRSPAHQLRRRPSATTYSSSHQPNDRNREIASLHLRAVQRRSKTKRASALIMVDEQDLP